MYRLYVDQKLLSLRERFDVNDEAGNPRFTVEGSLMKIPKEFWIRDLSGTGLARVWKQPVSWLPRFYLETGGVQVATIRKEFTLLRSRYTIEGPGIEVSGDAWSMSFELAKAGMPIGRVDKKWMSVRDRYAIEIDSPADELLVLGIVLAIDYVKRAESAAAAS